MLFAVGKVPVFSETITVPVLFHYIAGLEKNSPVYFSGHKVGRVADISFFGKDRREIQVMTSVAKDTPLKKDSEAFIDTIGFMGEKSIEFSAGSAASESLREGESLRGTDPVALMKVVKQGTELLGEFQKTNESIKQMVDDLKNLVGENKEDVNQIFDNLNASSQNLKEMTEDLKRHPWKLLRKSEEKKSKHFLFF